MRKLKLVLDSLTVNSSATSDEQDTLAAQGTVHAHVTPTLLTPTPLWTPHVTPPVARTISEVLCDADQQQEEQQLYERQAGY